MATANEDVLPPPGYQFKSPFFRYWADRARRKRMVQEDPKANNVKLAFCTACGGAYLLSEERPYSPCHATDPVLIYDLESLFESVTLLGELVTAATVLPARSDEPDQSPAPAPELPSSAQAGAAEDDSPPSPAPPPADTPSLSGVEAPSAAAAALPPLDAPRRRSPQKPKAAATP